MSDAPQDMKTVVEMALQLGQLQAGFLGQTAHELRSPMSHIMSLQQLILADLCDSPEEEREFIAQCYEASKKFMTLLDLAIDVSKLDYGTGVLKADVFDFADLVGELERIFVVKAKNQNLKFVAQRSDNSDGEIIITGDRQRTEQLLNTLFNTTINETSGGDIFFDYGATRSEQCNFEVRSADTTDFWQQAGVKDLAIAAKPSLETLKQTAQNLEFSPNLKWQLCEKIATGLGGGLTKEQSAEGFIQIRGWLPLGNKK